MKAYRVKHKPTGLYYQPHKHRGSNLSKNGKVYFNSTHGLSTALKYAAHRNNLDSALFRVFCELGSNIHKSTQSLLDWKPANYSRGQTLADTFLKDWELEELTDEQ